MIKYYLFHAVLVLQT